MLFVIIYLASTFLVFKFPAMISAVTHDCLLYRLMNWRRIYRRVLTMELRSRFR